MSKRHRAVIVYHDTDRCATLDDAEARAVEWAAQLRERGYRHITMLIEPVKLVGAAYVIKASASRVVD